MSRFRVEFAIPSARRSGVRTSSLPPGNALRVVLPRSIRTRFAPNRAGLLSHSDGLRYRRQPSMAVRLVTFDDRKKFLL